MYVITAIIVICVVLLFLRGFYLSYLDSLKEDVSPRQLSNDAKLRAASTRKCIGEYKNL